MKETVSARLDRHQLDDLEAFTKATGRDRAQLLREVVARGLHDIRLEEAARQYAAGDRSLSSSAQLAGVPVPDILAAMERLGLTMPYGADDFTEDLAWATSSTQAS